MTLELGEESPVLFVEIAEPKQAGAPLSTPQTVEASELGGDAVLDTSPQHVDCPEFIDDVAIRTPAPPLQPMPIDDFISTFMKPLSQSVLLLTPHLWVTRSARARAIEDDELVPKRSARLAAKSKHREQKPEAQARKVMMKRLGVEVETQLPDEASFQEFQIAFKLPLSSSTREAMQVLFLGRKQWASRAVRAA